MKTLEIFCGTKSFSKVASQLGHETFTIDNNEAFEPDLCADLLSVDIASLPKADIIWASPPCTTFSIASVSHHWVDKETPRSEEALIGKALVLRTIEIIRELKPQYFFIENPVGMLRKMRFMDGIEFAKYLDLPWFGSYRHKVTYCSYGDTRMKPTDIWTNLDWTPRKNCKNGATCHESAPRGSRTGTQGLATKAERGIVPRELFLELFGRIDYLTPGERG